MLKKTLLSLAVSSALYVSSSYALELGELTSQSRPAEPYRGRIQLMDANGLTPSDVSVRLGSESEFRQAGVPLTRTLSMLNFTVVRENGQLAVLVRSQQPLNIDQLDFVLAARWPSGQVVREYRAPLNQSALIDKVQPEVVQSVTPKPSVASKPSAAPKVVARATSATTSGSVFTKEAEQANRMPVKGQVNVSKGNTLWSIAGKNRPSNQLTIYQTMMAIQALNQDAFYANNINLLREGAVLRLPTKEQIELFNKAMSEQEFERQHAAWMALKQAGKLNGIVSEGQLNTQAKSKVAPAPKANAGDRLKLASGQAVLPEKHASSNEVQSKKVSQLEAQLSSTNELLDKETREKEELNTKLVDLNQQLETLEKLITLKDQQMADLQRQFSSAQQAMQEQKNTVDQLLEADQLRREQQAEVDESWTNKVFGNPIILSAAGAVLLLLGLLIGMLIKRSGRNKADKGKSDGVDEFDLAPAVAAAPVAAAAVAAVAQAAPESQMDDPFEDQVEEDPFAFDFEVDVPEDDFGSFDESVASVDVAPSVDDDFEVPELNDFEEPDAFEDALGAEMDELADDEGVEQDDPFAEFEVEESGFDEPSAFDNDDALNPDDVFEAESDLDLDDAFPELDEVAEDDFNEEESFVNSLLTDLDDQLDVDESSVFDSTPDSALADSIDEVLSEELGDDFGGLDVPEFGEEEAAADVDADDDEEPIDFFDASGDEVATKLDLARAYMDMGDEEGARVILDDVINSGNEAQIAEATSMMERMFPSE